jgi:hypothetical protein
MKKKYYKVVSKRRERFYSVWAKNKFCTCYHIGKWATAPAWLRKLNRGLLVFKTLEAAKKFIDLNHYAMDSDVLVFTCRISNPHKKLPPKCYMDELSRGKIRLTHTAWPKLTVMADKVMILENVFTRPRPWSLAA